LIDNIDNNGNTGIDYMEFMASTIDLNKVLTEDKMSALFSCFDVEHTGQITADSIKAAFTKFGREIDDKECN
jgi:Ca2+-binding EF-hand superfamily protein